MISKDFRSACLFPPEHKNTEQLKGSCTGGELTQMTSLMMWNCLFM